MSVSIPRVLCGIFEFPDELYYIDVTYGFTNRTPHMKLTRGAHKWLLKQMDSMYGLTE